MCNFGTEFVRRLEMTWNELVHLIFYNLSQHEPNKHFYDVSKVIVPYLIELWDVLQLPKHVSFQITIKLEPLGFNVSSFCASR